MVPVAGAVEGVSPPPPKPEQRGLYPAPL